MKNPKNSLKNLANITIATGLAIATQGTQFAISGIITGIASSFIHDTKYADIKELVRRTPPSTLNHDIKKTIIEAIILSIKNIQSLYINRFFPEEYQKNRLISFNADLIAEVELLNEKLLFKPDSIYKEIEKEENDSIYTLFDINIDDFPVVKKRNPYGLFFEKRFPDMLKLYFGELLKRLWIDIV